MRSKVAGIFGPKEEPAGTVVPATVRVEKLDLAKEQESDKAQKQQLQEAATLKSISAQKRKRSKEEGEAEGFRNQGVSLRVSYVNALRRLALDNNRFMYEELDEAISDYLVKRGVIGQ